MRKKIQSFFQAFWNWLRKVLCDKCGDFPLWNTEPEGRDVIEREIVINNTKVHIRSIFTGQTRLDEAMKKIITRRLSEKKKSI